MYYRLNYPQMTGVAVDMVEIVASKLGFDVTLLPSAWGTGVKPGTGGVSGGAGVRLGGAVDAVCGEATGSATPVRGGGAEACAAAADRAQSMCET